MITRSINKGFAQFRSGSSPAGADYEFASEIETQLARPGSVMGTNVLQPSQPSPVARLLRLRHAVMADSFGGSRVEARGLRRAAARRPACGPDRKVLSEGRPVRAPLRIAADSSDWS